MEGNMKILVLSDMTVSSVIRQQMPAEVLVRKYNHDINIASVFKLDDSILTGYDLYWLIRPTEGVAKLMDFIRSKINPKAKFLIDQDDCFDAIPKTHVAYKFLGKGNPSQQGACLEAMMRADIVTVSSSQLRDYYAQFNPRIVPNGWTNLNAMWKQENCPKHDGIIIGWAGTITHREDYKMAHPAVQQIMAEYPETKIVIGNDEEIFNLYRKIPLSRKAYVPLLPYGSYPGLVMNFTILLAPLKNDEFNQYKSDIKLVEAGAAMKPYVASAVPNYKAWGVGGLLAETPEEFYTHLKTLVTDEKLRKSLAVKGHKKALGREVNELVDNYWSKIVEEAISNERP